MQFSHLHNHTQFSLLDGASAIDKLFKKAAAHNMPGMAITDHGNMFGVFRFVAEAWKNTKVVGTKEVNGQKIDIKEPVVKPIVGCEFYLVKDRRVQSFSREMGKDKRFHQLFLAKDEIGYQNLTKMCSIGFIEGLYGKYPRIDKEIVRQYSEGLIATTCCIGASVPQAILTKSEAEAEEEFKWWLDIFGEDYYIEIQDHKILDQQKVNKTLLKFAEKYNVPIIASNDSHYVDREDANAHDILLCINTGEKQSTPTNKEFAEDDALRPKDTRFAFYNDEFYFKTKEEMLEVFAHHPEAIANTQMIVDKVKPLKLEKDILLPHFTVPDTFNEDQDAYLYHLTWKGARERYKDITEEIESRINFELFTIKSMGFAGYFLIVADFINAGKDMGVFIGPGRGSAAGSVVAYCIGITNIDPIKYNLLFERFLNPERKSMPDIDTDFDDTGRQKVIDYVVDKYGKNQVAHIITYGTMAAKMSIKDVARVMDMPLAQANTLAKLIPDKPGISLKRILRAPIDANEGDEKSLKNKEELKEDDIANVRTLRSLLEKGDLEKKVLLEAEKLEGSVRNTGIHAAGIIIAPKDLSSLLPVSKVKDVDLLVTQFDGSIIENAGVIKMDFLGLKTLSIIKDALALIKRNHGIDIDIDQIPLDDKLTFELYQHGDTNGTFQFESPGMQKHLRDLKPDQFEDLIAMNALYRPGPIKYIPNFINRKHGKENIHYDLPEMEEYLSETYGITVYQEQVMLLAQKLAGFSKGDADVLRKAMGKKQAETLAKMKAQFVNGAKEKGHPENILNKIWSDWEAFAQYAFNKSHSTCYALVAFQTAYIKAHYPAEYMAAVLNNTKSTEKITFFMEECRKMGLEVLGPDVNESRKEFSVNQQGIIRFGLSAIKGVGDIAMDGLVAEREENGPYIDIYDLLLRNNTKAVNKKSLEALTFGGALDSFSELNRATLFQPYKDSTLMETLIRFAMQVQDSQNSLENSLFGEIEMPEIKKPEIPFVPEWPLYEKLAKEKNVLGFYLSAHPLDEYKFEFANIHFTPTTEIDQNLNRNIRIAGFITDAYKGRTEKGDAYGRFKLNDFWGSVDISVWNEAYIKNADYIENDTRVVIEGIYKEKRFQPGNYEFQLQSMSLLSNAKLKYIKAIHFFLSSLEVMNKPKEFQSELSELIQICKEYPGNCPVSFTYYDYEEMVELELETGLSGGLHLSDELIYVFKDLDLIGFHVELK